MHRKDNGQPSVVVRRLLTNITKLGVPYFMKMGTRGPHFGGSPILLLTVTVLSRASAHGRSQLKLQKMRMGGYTEKELQWFNYPRARAHPGCEVSCQRVPNRLASSLRPCFVKASPKIEKAVSCYKADRLVAPLPSFRSVRSSLAYANFVLQGKNAANEATDGCVRTFDA